MNLFNLPEESYINENFSVYEILGKIGAEDPEMFDIISFNVESCYFYARINKDTYSFEYSELKDNYYNEILFLEVKLKRIINIDLLTKLFLKNIKSQLVITYIFENEYCIAMGIVDNFVNNRKIEQYCITSWMNKNTDNIVCINEIAAPNYKTLYNSVYQKINAAITDRYIPLSTVVSIYIYAHGAGEDYLDDNELEESIKKLFPQNYIKTESHENIYLFNENEAYKIICDNSAYAEGDNLMEVLLNYIEFENDFNIKLPKILMERIKSYGKSLDGEFMKLIDDAPPTTDEYEYEVN